jgi:hypothetical protein
MVLWSLLLSVFMVSLGFGLAIYLYTSLPVFPNAHPFSQSSLFTVFKNCLTVCRVVGVYGWAQLKL